MERKSNEIFISLIEKNLEDNRQQLPQRDMVLNNGLIARFSFEDEWKRNVYEIDLEEKTFEVVDVNCVLYSLHLNGEPNSPLKVEFQPREVA